MSSKSNEFDVARTEEPATYDDTYAGSLSKPETDLRLWDEDEWAMGILNQGFVDPSRTKLDRRVREFLQLANPTEREGLEAGRSELVVLLQEAQREYKRKYPSSTAESVQFRRQGYKTKTRAACRAFAEGAYEYSKIMDMLAGQAPEYVALVWGAIKIVLIVQINHEELKQKVQEHIKLIKSKFEIMDHLTVLLPRANLIAAIARALTSEATWKAFSKPWRADLQGLVDEISQTFEHVKDISQFHSLLEVQATREIGRLNLHNSTESRKIQEQSLARLSELESMMERIQSTILRFSKEQDIQQTANYLRQHMDEDLLESQQTSLPAPGQQQDPEDGPSNDIEYDLEALKEELFIELQDSYENAARRGRSIEQKSEMREHRSEQRNLVKTDQLIAWLKSDSSQLLWIDGNDLLRKAELSILFMTPLVILGESKYESLLIMRHSCGDRGSKKVSPYRLLVQALLYQVFEQNPGIFMQRKTSLTRNLAGNVAALWHLFLSCIKDTKVDCIFIFIDQIDGLMGTADTDTEEGGVVLKGLNALVQDNTKLVKVLLTASLAVDRVSPSEGRAALMIPRRKNSLAAVENELALVPHKLIEIQQRRCKAVSFTELAMLYLPGATVYSLEDGDLRAYVLLEISGMEPRSFDSYNPLKMRAWSVGHNGQHIARQYHDLVIPQFSGQRKINSMQYIPMGYLPNEIEERRNLIARGKLWWKYSIGFHHVTIMDDEQQGVADQINREMSESGVANFQEEIPSTPIGTLKPLYYLLCPPCISIFLLNEQKWSTTLPRSGNPR
ncbi:MAG: hypothetical protein Q9195_002556 [Heterodermia aff. obscurata]